MANLVLSTRQGHGIPSPTRPCAQRGFADTIGWGNRPALLLVDVCNAYWTEHSPLDTRPNPASAAVPASIAKLAHAARQGHVPLIWTRAEYMEPGMADAGLFACKVPLLHVFQRGGGAGQVVVFKRYPSALFATHLSTRLRGSRLDTLVICGVSTSGRVRATALDPICPGSRPTACTTMAMTASVVTVSVETCLTMLPAYWRDLW